jgi:hypothetical protein
VRIRPWGKEGIYRRGRKVLVGWEGKGDKYRIGRNIYCLHFQIWGPICRFLYHDRRRRTQGLDGKRELGSKCRLEIVMTCFWGVQGYVA